MDSLDPKAVAAANQALWKNNPELKGRQLTAEPKDESYRQEWMQHYRDAEKQTPKPPPPKVEPKPIVEPPPAAAAGKPCVACGDISGMTHEEKMLKAYEMAKQKLPDAIREELPDPAVFVGMMAVVGGILAVATFATGGLAAFAAGVLVGLAVVGAALTGYEIGQVLNGLYGFFDKTRCDKAQTEADLDAAANDLAGAFAKGGIAGVMAILTGLMGKAGGKIAKKLKSKPKALSKELSDKVRAMEKGTRPDPRTYLSEEQIKLHAEAFEEGASRLMLKGNLDKYGPAQRDGTSFVMPKKEVDKLLLETNGDKRALERALGLPDGMLDADQLVRVDIPNPKGVNVRIPSGNEAGANSQWIPGGKLPGGNHEAVVDLQDAPKGTWKATPINF
jgi:hypothetical protein